MDLIFCSTSIAAYDRRMIRIIEVLDQTDQYNIKWISRMPKSKGLNASASNLYVKSFFSRGALFYAEYNFKLFFKLLSRRADIISAVDMDTLLACTLASKILGSKLVFDSHEFFSEVPELNEKPLVKKVWKWIGKFCIPHTDKRYTVGPMLAEALSLRYKEAFQVIRNISPDFKAVSKSNTISSEPKKYITYLGALNMGRGLPELIQAMSQLSEEFHLSIIGSGDLDDALKSQVDSIGIGDRVTFTGMVDPSQIQDYLEKAWCGINLLDRLSQSYYLSLGNKVFDYINASLPAIQMDYPELRKLNENKPTSILIQNLNLESIVNAINQLSVQSTYSQLKDNCLAIQDEFSWDKESSTLVEIYDSLSA